MATFDERLARWLDEAIARLPQAAQADLDRVHLFVTADWTDPRYRVALLHADTAEHQRRVMEEAERAFSRDAARWNGAAFAYYEWGAFGDPTEDPEGAAGWRTWALGASLGWDPDVPAEAVLGDEDEVQALHDAFVEQVLLGVERWRRSTVLPGAESLLVTIGSDKPGDPIVSLNQRLNGSRLPADAERWYAEMEEELNQ